MTERRVLVAGIGNVLFGDDGFGVAVAERLLGRPRPLAEGIVVMNVGIRGFDLTSALLDGYDVVILVDATQRGRPPGTLYVLDPSVEQETAGATLPDGHRMDPTQVLAFVRASGAQMGALRVVGCEPASLGGTDGEPFIGLSAPVEAAVDGAVDVIETLVRDFVSPVAAGTAAPCTN